MNTLIVLAAFLLGAGLTYLLLHRQTRAAADAANEESRRGAEHDRARQQLALELAALRPEANRTAQAAIELLQKDDEIVALSRQNTALATQVEERGRAEETARMNDATTIRELKADMAGEHEKVRAGTARILQLEREKSGQEASLQEREEALQRERRQLDGLKDQFRSQFAELSADALRANNQTFLDTARKELQLKNVESEGELARRQEKIEEMVRPLQEGLKAVQEAAREMEAKRERSFGTIEQQLRDSVEAATEVARQASALKDALKRPNVRGRWGEVQLKNCIDLAGMDEHCDVILQDSTRTADDEVIRPDMTVRMPGGRKVAVDSKTPMDHFLKYIEASSDEERNTALHGHARALRMHVASLVKSDYMQKIANGPDFVVLFLPNESFLALALEKDGMLMEEALNKKVLIATPATLIGLLKVIRYGWNEQRIAENAKQIAEVGSKLNTEISRFLEDFVKIGEALKTATDAYESGAKRVEKQITNRARDLHKLGSRSSKKLSGKAQAVLDIEEEVEETAQPLLGTAL